MASIHFSESPRSSSLYTPIKVGSSQLKHRVVLAPLTRQRANKEHVHGPLAIEYYAQRAAVPGTLLITEATFIAPQAGGYDYVPGIWGEEQIVAWKKITDAVHARGSVIYLQLWALGRTATPEVLDTDPLGPFPFVAPSPIPVTPKPGSRSSSDPSKPPRIPRELTLDEIREYIGFYAQATSNAVHKAGFDGVEIHGANGYLIDQFLQDVSNKRTDVYGGTLENRARFCLEVVDAVVKEIGAKRTGIRFSPWGTVQDMRMEDPIPTFSYVAKEIRDKYPTFAYIHLVEPRVTGSIDCVPREDDSNDFLREIWNATSTGETSPNESGRVFISAGGYTAELAEHVADTKGDVTAFGRFFIPNPDLPVRLQKRIPLTPYDRSTFYKIGSPEGYIDYDFADKETEEAHLRAGKPWEELIKKQNGFPNRL